MAQNDLKGSKNFFELRRNSSYIGSSNWEFLMRVSLEIFTVQTNSSELYEGSSYGEFTVLG